MISNSGAPLESITKKKTPRSIFDSFRTSLKIRAKKVDSKKISNTVQHYPGTSLDMVTKFRG